MLKLSGELTIYRAAEMKAQLLSALEACPDRLEVDLAEVSDLDSAGLQVLVVAKQVSVARGIDMQLIGHSLPVVQVFELLNVAGIFGDPLVISQPA